MKEKCESHREYNGDRMPTCCGGDGCGLCWKKYALRLSARVDSMRVQIEDLTVELAIKGMEDKSGRG